MENPKNKILVIIVTPEEKVFEGEVDFISIPGQSGSMGILPRHLPIISQLKIGVVKMTNDKDTIYIGVCRGYFEYLYGKANILTERAIRTTYEDREKIIEELKEKHNIIQEITEETKTVIQAMANLRSLEH
jgi:F-type H+-transporting ATPase subunit epsilon